MSCVVRFPGHIEAHLCTFATKHFAVFFDSLSVQCQANSASALLIHRLLCLLLLLLAVSHPGLPLVDNPSPKLGGPEAEHPGFWTTGAESFRS